MLYEAWFLNKHIYHYHPVHQGARHILETHNLSSRLVLPTYHLSLFSVRPVVQAWSSSAIFFHSHGRIWWLLSSKGDLLLLDLSMISILITSNQPLHHFAFYHSDPLYMSLHLLLVSSYQYVFLCMWMRINGISLSSLACFVNLEPNQEKNRLSPAVFCATNMTNELLTTRSLPSLLQT